jgi:hypothetical protein
MNSNEAKLSLSTLGNSHLFGLSGSKSLNLKIIKKSP